jgi:RNA-dependent RNA polymerase
LYDHLIEKVLTDMANAQRKTRHPAHMFRALYLDGLEVENAFGHEIPEFCANLPKITITPCRVTVTGFQLEMSNRLVRKFTQDHGFSPEAFVRVTIADENGDKLFSDDISDQVSERIKNLVLDGLHISGKQYRFLAYSSSQLKELSLWMVCPEHGWSVKRMRDSMGNFSMCKTPSKYAARVGQCFSTTIDTSDAVQGQTTNGSFRVKDDHPDIVSSMNGVHSDGVGLIRKEVLEGLMARIPFAPSDPSDASAIQIRYGGAKGVLMGWNFDTLNDQRCRDHDILLRPSMVKFHAPYDRLEVVAVASHIPYYLNRNVILLGSYHGISGQALLGMQVEMLEKLNRMLTDGKFARAFLPRLSGPDSVVVSALGHMLSAGISPDKDPFLFSCLHATRSHHLMNLRKKARIHVEQGAVLIGGIDETGLVPEGCVFVQVRKGRGVEVGHGKEDNEFTPLEGPVMVTKHPVMHPGDTRMLLAVGVPALADKRNVILFSKHGERPEADKMAGSDLDGDQFAVTWDERLFLRQTEPPMDYSPPASPEGSDGITDESLVSHFINHAKNDNLGRISMLWLDHAIKKGAACDECLELAKLHSIAVDFPKSGVPAVLDKNLILKRSEPRAHWREKKGSDPFHDKGIVGQLYDQIVKEINSKQGRSSSTCHKAVACRNCDRKGQILIVGEPRELLRAKETIYDPLLPRRLGWMPSDLELLQGFANEQRQQYESQLLSLMNQYKIKSEGEVVTGCIMKYHKLQ